MAHVLMFMLLLVSSAVGFEPSWRTSVKAVRNSPSSTSSFIKTSPTEQEPKITIKQYNHKNWKLSYLYKPSSPGKEFIPPVVFIHPVGIGLSSWFWTKVMNEYEGTTGGCPALYAVDLIGCGLEHGSDAWDPQKEGLFFPLSWVEGVETLIQNVVLPEYNSNRASNRYKSWDIIPNSQNKGAINGCTVVVQGGLASVGILLSSRNPTSFVSKLILTSPPIYDDMITPLPPNELETNYNFLASTVWGSIAFSLLESRPLIRLFSDLVLFSKKCDEDWLDYTMEGASFKEARTPVQAFNAGLLRSRSFEEELQTLEQRVLILNGVDDKRNSERIRYTTDMKNCEMKELGGLNVLPWENPKDIVSAIINFTR